MLRGHSTLASLFSPPYDNLLSDSEFFVGIEMKKALIENGIHLSIE